MTLREIFEDIDKTVKLQNQWRGNETLNMIASENQLSPYSSRYIDNDFHHRYAEGLIGKRAYQGQKYQDKMEKIVLKLVSKVFGGDFADVRPPTATIGNLAIFYGLCKPRDKYMALELPHGAHISFRKYGAAGCRNLNIKNIPYNPEKYNIDIEKTKEKILEEKPKLITLGGSVYLFPHPLNEIKSVCEETNTIIHYDGSHVLGLIAGGCFQDPLKEGADILLGSTHKTLPGPQGAVILGATRAKKKNPKIFKKIRNAIFPGLISNHHLWRFPPLAITLLESLKYGKKYANQVIHNAQYLAQCLHKQGFDVCAKKMGFTKSHQILLNVRNLGGGEETAKRLEEANIICNKNTLFEDDEKTALKNPSGLRLGAQELTRFGMVEKDMEYIAELYSRLLINNEKSDRIKREVINFRKKHKKIHFCFDNSFFS